MAPEAGLIYITERYTRNESAISAYHNIIKNMNYAETEQFNRLLKSFVTELEFIKN